MRSYRPADGLPQAQVTAVVQDPSGFLWVGTQAGGVARYDGRRWETFDAESGLSGSSVYGLAVDSRGFVYAASNGGAARYTGHAWELLPLPKDPGHALVTAIALGSRDEVYLGTYAGLVVLEAAAGAPVTLESDASLLGAQVQSLAEGPQGLFVGTSRGLGFVARGGPRKVVRVGGLPEGAVGALLPRADGTLLVSIVDEGLFAGKSSGTGNASGANLQFQRVGDDAVPGRRVTCLATESEASGVAWVGTVDRGAYRLRGDVFEPFGLREGLASPRVHAIFEDREGVLWFGTDSGLTKRAPSAFLTYADEDGVPTEAGLFGMAESRDGSLWIAGWESGLVRLARDGSARTFQVADGLPDARVTDVAALPGGDVVVATRRGLALVDDRGRVSKMELPKDAPQSIRTVAVLPGGGLALGTSGEGLTLVENGVARRIGAPVGSEVGALFVTRDGTLWAGGAGWGAAAIQGGKVVEALSSADGLPSNLVNGILVDARGRLWLATDRGVFCREKAGGATRVLGRSAGLPDAYVYWVGEDLREGLWFGTNHGVARLDAATSAIDIFTVHDGLGANECNEDGFLVDSTGRVLIATAGVSVFLGRPRPRRAADPVAVITSARAGGRDLSEYPEGLLPARSGAISFRFTAPSFTSEGSVRFRYRLRGLDDSWVRSAPGQDETTYGGLGPGRYELEVLAETADGRVSRAPARAAFGIRPLFYRTITFSALALGLLLTALAAVVRLRERRLEASREALEKEVRERTEELRRANERLASLAVTDELTGLANRRRILEAMNEEIAFARRRDLPFSVAMADLDHFKEVNDASGHAAGDRLLVAAAAAMKDVLRTEDLLGRVGGEEFLAVLPGTDAEGARAVGERIRRAVEKAGLGPAGHLATTSVGVASIVPGVTDAGELLRRADAALYRAKSLGRNRVEAFEEPARNP